MAPGFRCAIRKAATGEGGRSSSILMHGDGVKYCEPDRRCVNRSVPRYSPEAGQFDRDCRVKTTNKT